MTDTAKSLSEIAIEDKIYNAFITLNQECSIAASAVLHAKPDRSRIPLEGFSLAIKDNIAVAGLPCTGGTPALKGYVPKKDAPVVARLREAGAIILGKTNLHELAFGVTNNNTAFGPTGNAHNPQYLAGGSSGGSAVAVARGFVRAALGTDTRGSCRIPAALNGIVGFRPSIKRYSAEGIIRISETRDTIGILASNVADVILLDGVIAGNEKLEKPDLQTLCIGVPRQHFHEDLDPDVAQAMEAALRKFKAAGIALVEEDLPIDALNNRASRSIVLYEAGILLPAWLRENGIGIDMAAFHSQIASPDVKAIIGDIMGGAIKESIYRRALHEYRPKMRELWQTYFAKHKVDAIIFPTTPLPARKIQGSDKTVELNNRRTHTLPAYIRNVDPASVVGAPAISIPMGISENRMPIGLEIEAAINNDRRLLAIAQALSWLLTGQ